MIATERAFALGSRSTIAGAAAISGGRRAMGLGPSGCNQSKVVGKT